MIGRADNPMIFNIEIERVEQALIYASSDYSYDLYKVGKSSSPYLYVDNYSTEFDLSVTLCKSVRFEKSRGIDRELQSHNVKFLICRQKLQFSMNVV